MSFINKNSKELYCKVLYTGPPQSGKTTNIQQIYKKTSAQNENSERLSLPLEPSSSNLFDFLPLSLGKIRDFSTRFHLYTIPGDTLFKSTGKIILKGLDGIVFVADSDPLKTDQNIQYLKKLKQEMEDEGYILKKTPLVIQYNKRDIENAEPIAQLRMALNHYNSPDIPAAAQSGEGVIQTLTAISKIIITVLKGGSLN